MATRSPLSKYYPLNSHYLAHIVLIVGLSISNLVPAVASAHAQTLTLEEVVSTSYLASGTPNIDAAVVTPEISCAFSAGTHSASSEIPTSFHAASISKLFTAIVIMQLRDEGALSLQDLVGDYEPTFSTSPIRIEHLLTHTSGLRDRKRAEGRTTDKEVDAYIHSLAKQRIGRSPGTKWRYADAGFNLLGRIIERITSKSFSEVMKERLLTPIRMEDSDFDVSQIRLQNRHQAYDKRGKPRPHPWDRAFLPSSGLQTSAIDLASFGYAVLSISNEDPQSILSFESLQEMTVMRIPTNWNGISQGYGWQLANTLYGLQWRHAGGEAGFEGLLTLYPESRTVVAVLGNKQDWPRFELEQEIMRWIFKTPNVCADS
jgi:CubicO group peptidase (beta-lactamase class C family)